MANHAYIGPRRGFTAQMGHLVSMMDYTRTVTLQLVQGLTLHELDYIHDEYSNSIGSLLTHIGAIERAQQIWSFEGRDFNLSEREELDVPMKLGLRARSEIHGRTMQEYLNYLADVRSKTYEELQKRDDSWLYQEVLGKETNQYCRWFHVIEDEISHRGQMKWLLSRLKRQHQGATTT